MGPTTQHHVFAAIGRTWGITTILLLGCWGLDFRGPGFFSVGHCQETVLAGPGAPEGWKDLLALDEVDPFGTDQQPADTPPETETIGLPAPLQERTPDFGASSDTSDQPIKANADVAIPSGAVALSAPEIHNIDFAAANELVDLEADGAALDGVLRLIAQHHGLNLVLGPNVGGPVTVSIHGVKLSEVLDAICGVAGFTWHRSGNLLYVTSSTAPGVAAHVQGRFLRVYPLNYVSAADVQGVINGLLSSVGNVAISEASVNDRLRTQETVIVEDVAAAHQRIAQYLAQYDVPPKQVLIEAHVFQINLDTARRHGINLQSLARLSDTRVEVAGSGFAEVGPTGPSLALSVDGTDFNGLVEAIEELDHSRTLASPKLAVVNHQEGRIQIGERLPFSVSTTTQTTTVQNVQFLEVGVVLTVRPIITDDGNILMTVLPKVSGGQVAANGFPEETTTEVESTVLVPDGSGLVIGGLIREELASENASVPGLSKIPFLGKLFQRKTQTTLRNEIVVALVAHVIHQGQAARQKEIDDLQLALPDHTSRALTTDVYPQVEILKAH